MPKNFTTPQQIAAQYNAAAAQGAVNTNYNYTLLQNAYNPYAVQTGYRQSMPRIIQEKLGNHYCIDGEWMTMLEFVNSIYPEDCAEKTFLILKLNGKKEEKK